MKYALGISLFLHVLVICALVYRPNSSKEAARQGTVSIDFIESVAHTEEMAGSLPRSLVPASKQRQSHNPLENSSRSSASGPTASAISNETNLYVANVMELLNKSKIYPRKAIERELEGRVIVGLSLDRDGSVLSLNIEMTSSFELLDRSALQTIQKIAKFPPLPPELAAPLHLHVPMVFKIEHHRR